MNRIQKKHEKIIAKMALERGLLNCTAEELYWNYSSWCKGDLHLYYCSGPDCCGEYNEHSVYAAIAEYLWWHLNDVFYNGEHMDIVKPIKNVRTAKQIIAELRKFPRKIRIGKLIIREDQ